MFKEEITDELHKILEKRISKEEIRNILEVPANQSFGEFSFPTFALAKILKKSPKLIAEELAEQFKLDSVSHIKTINGFLNFYIDRDSASKIILNEIRTPHTHAFNRLKGQTIVIDYSSPNIAKPFSMGHFRATVLGDALSKILEKSGANVIGINHLGDWGTQFGKLIVAYKEWGEFSKVQENPIKELFELYQKFHVEAETNPILDNEARNAFNQLEHGNNEYTELWLWFREVSIQAFQSLYVKLNIEFDYIQGESFYNNQLNKVSDILEEKELLELDQGAYIVRLNETTPPALIKKKDGASLYITRDIAAMLYREKQYHPNDVLYVVGQEQSVHFNQLGQMASLLDVTTNIEHIPFGLILKNGKKMSTRKGAVVLLEDIINDVEIQALEVITEKNPNLINKEKIAEKVSIAAIKFFDLKYDRLNSYEFNIKDMLKFDGETGVYVMYTNSRIQSILRKSVHNGKVDNFIYEDKMWPVLNQLSKYPEVIMAAADKRMPSEICKYVIGLCRLFNSYYGSEKIIGSDNEISRIQLLHIVSDIIKDAMMLLGIETVDEM